MRRSRQAGLGLLALSLAITAVGFGAPSQASTSPAFTWRQRSVGEESSFTEPSISVDKKGNIAVCAPGSPGGTQLWLSKDDGHSFDYTHTEGNGGGDCEIHFLPDGRLVNSDLAITTSYISVSEDGGHTWRQTDDAGQEQDRQWFASFDQGEPTLYHVYHGIVEEYEFFVKSTDGGETWSLPVLINSADQFAGPPGVIAKPGDTASLVDQGYNTFSGPMVVDQKTGDLYVAYSISNAQSNVAAIHGFGPTRGVVVAHSPSGDLGTWTNRYAAVTNDPAPTGGTVNGAIFPWLAIDDAGTVYVIFNSSVGGTFHTYYAYSTDKTETWSEPIKVDANPDGVGGTVYAVGQGGTPGVLDLAWMSSSKGLGPDDLANEWHVDFAQIRNAGTATPQITRSRVSDHIIHKGQICQMGLLCVTGGDRSLGDFFELAIGPDGMAQIVWADNGREDEPREVYWAKQTSGASAFANPIAPPKPTQPKPANPNPPGAPRPGAGPAPTHPATGLPAALPMLAIILVGSAVVALRRRDAG